MNNIIITIIITSAPLILLGIGALLTEYTGTLAVFIDGIINLGAFLCIVLSIKTGSITAGIIFSILLSSFFIFAISLFTIKTRSNPFLTGLGINFLVTGSISFFSQHFFNTTSIISEPIKNIFNENTLYIASIPFSLISWGVAIVIIILIDKTVWGTHMYITGTDPEVLEARGLNINKYKLASWTIAAALSAFAGSIYALRISAFASNISSGRGWIALVAIFIGQKKGWGTLAVLLAFSIVDYAINALQGSNLIHISPTLLLSVPYIVALLLFILQPKNN